MFYKIHPEESTVARLRCANGLSVIVSRAVSENAGPGSLNHGIMHIFAKK